MNPPDRLTHPLFLFGNRLIFILSAMTSSSTSQPEYRIQTDRVHRNSTKMSDPVPEDQQDQSLPTNPEDRRAAAALSALNTNEDPTSASKLPSTDQESLGKAMSRLEIAAGQPGGKAADAKNPPPTQRAAAEAKKKANVKVSAEDVGLLVSDSLLYLYFGKGSG